MPPTSPDVVVIGAGAIGACTALALSKAGVRVLVVEKEAEPALHQSSRNSGVIHAGYNLAPGSLKARFCVEGNRRLRAYCKEHGIPLLEGGILIVAKRDGELATLDELKRRSDANGVTVQIIDQREMGEIEPHAKGVAALHAPDGASFDSGRYVRNVVDQVRAAGGTVQFGVSVRKVSEVGKAVRVVTSSGTLSAPVVVNCAGLHADRVAARMAKDLRVIPFRGYYAELTSSATVLIRSHVYAAPDLSFPFLGVHLSRQTDGRVLVGPGAMLAFGRESYGLHHVHPRDLAATMTWPGFYRLFGEPKFRGLVRSEVTKSFSLKAIWREAHALVPELDHRDLRRSLAGNRAQLVTRDGKLVNDILVRETERAVHVLNAVSPGLTASLPFGEYVANKAEQKLR